MPAHRAGSYRFAHASFAFALLLAACGGGDDTSAPETASGREQRAGFFPGTTIPADAHQKGMWSPVYNWPLISVHAVLMPDGRVLTYGTNSDGKQTGNFIYDVWEGTGAPDAGHRTLSNSSGTDLFCSSQLVLPLSGDVFIAGGDNWTGTATTNTGNNNSNVISGANESIARGLNMNRPRWYSSSTTLLNGETYIQGGSGGTDRPEVRQADGTFRLLSSADTGTLNFMYPRNFIAPDGRVFGYDSNGRMYYVNPTGTGSIQLLSQFGSAYRGNDASAAMFRPGRILQFGGASNGAVVIDINGASPVVTATSSLSSQRRLVNATILANGDVLATGGSQVWNEMTGVNNNAEIWNPQTGQWTLGATAARARLYHGNALLLPDASVLVTGGGAPGPQNNTNSEIYYPPYLFTSGGQRAARPSITDAPTALAIGKTFAIDVSGGVSRVTLVKTGSTTHSFNMEQRFLDLTFAANGSRVAVQAPTRAAEAPPGFYMLFVLDAAGVPSQARFLRIDVAANPNPSIAPVLVSPGDQSGNTGAAAGLQLSASDPNGDALTYAATGLPPGLALNTATGAISGTPTSGGSYNVVVSASDGINADSKNFVWTVSNGTPLAFTALPQPTAVQSSGSVTYTASATGSNVLYKWNFGDGSPETAWSASSSATHAYARPGTFSVTVTIMDDNNPPQSRSFLQQVYLPATVGRPSASSNVLLEGTRLWVVNQDNDSVSAFDVSTRAKLGEVAVGAAPRSMAVAANGLLWVTNKRGASISVIDPASCSVVRTIALPRASMPYGIATSPSGDAAYVALEASGKLLKLDTASDAQLASVDVGANVRHVSVSADGSLVLVSRFITPLLPGEATASVAPSASDGGEVLLVEAGSMSVLRTLVLRTSDKPDFENQGRGVPNYLGAAVISPDGTQAWVPSKQDNVQRGALRDGSGLNFQSTVRAISSRIELGTNTEDYAKRIDHDNASLASAAAYDPRGVYLFVALETSREVAVIDAHGGFEVLRFAVGRAPQGLATSADGKTLYVNNFMDRSVGVYDLRPLVEQGQASVPLLAALNAVASERLQANVLLGKKLFHDARDARLARDRYMSCASCHNDGGNDGRVWDLTGFGEGLRNTISLRGRAGAQGRLHWSHNFDEVQDFEGQIRALAGGSGLMSDAAFNAGTRSQPLGDAKAGQSADLDALAAYVASLEAFEPSPYRQGDGQLTSQALQGRSVFQQQNCASCHSGSAFSGSGSIAPANIGTIKPSSGQRLGAALTAIDIPTLRDVWATAPYLHDGSASTLDQAVLAHNTAASINAGDLASLTAYLRQIGSEETSAPSTTGSGLTGRYFNNRTLSGTAALTRVEAIDFGWGSGAPGPGVGSNNFSVRWTGKVKATTSGNYRFQTYSDDGVRVWVNGTRIINNWTDHSPTTDTSGNVNLTGGQQYTITVEYYENGGGAVMRLRWRPPGAGSYVAIPAAQLYPN